MCDAVFAGLVQPLQAFGKLVLWKQEEGKTINGPVRSLTGMETIVLDLDPS